MDIIFERLENIKSSFFVKYRLKVYKYTTHVFSRVFREFFVKYMFFLKCLGSFCYKARVF